MPYREAWLDPTLEALKNGKTVALANKESLVMAGRLISKLVRDTPAKLIPVDSEHSRPLSASRLHRGRGDQDARHYRLRRPVQESYQGRLRKVRPEEAMKHPTWKMGKK